MPSYDQNQRLTAFQGVPRGERQFRSQIGWDLIERLSERKENKLIFLIIDFYQLQ